VSPWRVFKNLNFPGFPRRTEKSVSQKLQFGEKSDTTDLKDLKNLWAKYDTQNLIRCFGRMQNAELYNYQKFPNLLPRNDRLTFLIVLQIHYQIKHFGVNHTLCEVRQKYWIPKGRF